MKRNRRPRSIRFQLTVIILAMVMTPLCIMFFANRYYIQSRLYRQTDDTYATALSQTGSYISDKAILARNIVSMFYGDRDVQQGIDFSRNGSDIDDRAWLADLSSGRVTYKGAPFGALSRVYLYQDDVPPYFRSDKLYASLDASEREIFETWAADSGQFTCFLTLTEAQLGYKPRYIYYLAKVPSATRLGQYIGIIEADIPVSTFANILDSAPGSAHSALYLVSSDGAAFLSSGDARFDDGDLANLRALLEKDGPGTGMRPVRYAGETYLAGMEEIRGTDWRIVMVVPIQDVTGITRGADQILLITMLVLLLLILPATALIAHSILKPVYKLQEGVNAIAQGDYSVNVPASGTLELDNVIESFNFMRRQTRVMMDEQYRMGQDLKNKELQVLQEQINPHFLYNTIDLLLWEARNAGNREMEEIIYALSQFYKLSLGHGEEIVTLRHELDHVSAYMRIQNIRFLNRVRLVLDVPEALDNVHIVKMVLQPLVENSIQHGIREKPDETGVIEIRARRAGDAVEITVTDDGVGMDEETLSRIVSSEHPGYGVYNVNDRLILHYGSSAGLEFHSAPGAGTSVTMRIPFDTVSTLK